MFRFENDYSTGCIDEILERMTETNLDATPGYRLDPYCESAAARIRNACGCEDLDVHFLVGGTQANMTVLKAILRPQEGVISPELGHVNVHEAGAIEGTGHKVLTIREEEDALFEAAKITAHTLDDYLEKFFALGDWHRVQPGAVYISHPTERGALYSKKELMDIKAVCEKFDLPLFVDGARLSYALACPHNDITLEDLAKYTDIFYIGGTKCGALLGEAVVFTNNRYNRAFNIICKGSGAVLAKGRLLGIQFDVLFSDDNYRSKSVKAAEYALRIRDAFRAKNVDFITDSLTNQQFPILTKAQQERIRSFGISFNLEKVIDEEHDCVRFCTSWSTTDEEMNQLEKAIAAL